MELPAWLKVENIIKNLNFSNWFNGWFRFHKNTTTFIGNINIDTRELEHDSLNNILLESDKLFSTGVDGNQVIVKSYKDEFDLSAEEKYLVYKINQVHVICGRSMYSFENNYKQALNHIRNKPTKDWYECAAKDMVQVKEDIDFFSAFQEVNDPAKIEIFNGKQKDINYLYSVIQKIKHSNKRGDVQSEFLSPFDKRFNNDVMTEEKYEDIFLKYQNNLIDFFKEFKLKGE